MNKVLITEYNPTMVISPGLSQAESAAKPFGLKFTRTFSSQGKRLVEHYHDSKRCWFFTRHWSGAFGFSTAQKNAIKEYLQAHRVTDVLPMLR
jgi:hypothetical protein